MHDTPNQPEHEDRLLVSLKFCNRMAVRALAVLMTIVILLGVVDVAWTLWERLMAPPIFILTISDILGVFGAFMAVLIAIEIFINITIYLTDNVIHVQIVMATALMAIARKVIIIDFKDLDAMYVFGTAAVVLAMSVGYWLVNVKDPREASDERNLRAMATQEGVSNVASPTLPAGDNQGS